VYRRRVGHADANEVEAQARAINAEPWEPLPGMVKAALPGLRLLVRGQTRTRRSVRTVRSWLVTLLRT